AANAIAFLEYGNRMAGAGQLLRAGQASRARADHGDFLARLATGRLGRHPALRPALVDNGVLDGLDAHRIVVDVQGTGRLAGGGTHAAGELGEVVGGVQHFQRAMPILLVDQVVPVGNDVVDGTAAGAERNAAVHTAGALLPGLGIG